VRDSRPVCVEANGNVAVIHTEQLINHSTGYRRVWIVNLSEHIADLDKSEIVVSAVIARRPKADRCSNVVEPGDLGLHRVGKVFVSEVCLGVRGNDGVALVWVASQPVARAKVPGDHPGTVNSQLLIECRIGIVDYPGMRSPHAPVVRSRRALRQQMRRKTISGRALLQGSLSDDHRKTPLQP